VLILSDLQIPYHDEKFVWKVVDLARAWGVETVLINGDLDDQSGASKHPASPKESDLSASSSATRAFAAWLTPLFKKVWFDAGNHDTQITRKLDLNLDFDTVCWMLLGEVKSQWCITRHPAVFVGTEWLVCHPRGTSVIATRYPQMLAEKYSLNVVGAHGHTWGQAKAKNGRYAIDSGMCARANRLAYQHFQIGNRPFMQQGAVFLLLLKEGSHVHVPYCVTPDSDWNALKRLYSHNDLLSDERDFQ
jgi:hypothetical protein